MFKTNYKMYNDNKRIENDKNKKFMITGSLCVDSLRVQSQRQIQLLPIHPWRRNRKEKNLPKKHADRRTQGEVQPHQLGVLRQRPQKHDFQQVGAPDNS